MSTLTIPRARVLLDVRVGDLLTAYDSHTLGPVRNIVAVEHNALVLTFVGYEGAGPHRLYPDSGVERNITVERPDPKPRKPARRQFDGLVLVNDPRNGWVTEDGQHGVHHGSAGITYCDGPHPVRISPGMAQEAQEPIHRGSSWARPVLAALRAGKRGYYCEGGEEHEGEMGWIPWSNDTSIDARAHAVCTTLAEGADALRRAIEQVGR